MKPARLTSKSTIFLLPPASVIPSSTPKEWEVPSTADAELFLLCPFRARSGRSRHAVGSRTPNCCIPISK
jgi:hypothetical protein